MNYVVIYTIPYNTRLTADYSATEGVMRGHPVYMPVNAVLTEKIEDGSNVSVLVIEKEKCSDEYNELAVKCKAETAAVLNGKNCNICINEMKMPFEATNTAIGKIYVDLLEKLPRDSKIIADITFGPKFIPMLINCLLDYSSRFLNCEVDSVLYGQVNWVESSDDKKHMIKEGCSIRDVSSVYLISEFAKYFGSEKEEYDKFLKGFVF